MHNNMLIFINYIFLFLIIISLYININFLFIKNYTAPYFFGYFNIIVLISLSILIFFTNWKFLIIFISYFNAILFATFLQKEIHLKLLSNILYFFYSIALFISFFLYIQLYIEHNPNTTLIYKTLLLTREVLCRFEYINDTVGLNLILIIVSSIIVQRYLITRNFANLMRLLKFNAIFNLGIIILATNSDYTVELISWLIFYYGLFGGLRVLYAYIQQNWEPQQIPSNVVAIPLAPKKKILIPLIKFTIELLFQVIPNILVFFSNILISGYSQIGVSNEISSSKKIIYPYNRLEVTSKVKIIINLLLKLCLSGGALLMNIYFLGIFIIFPICLYSYESNMLFMNICKCILNIWK